LVYFISETIADIFAFVIVLSLLFLFIYANCKIFKIAKSKPEDKRVVPTTATSMDENGKTRILNLKSVFFGSWLFFLLFLPVHYIFTFTFRIRNAIVW
jgi:nitrate/nitrite transporter NarK